MIFVLTDVNDNNVEIRDDELANILDTLNMEYDGEDDTESFIDWIRYGCDDSEEYDDEDC
jgi:hypothetical protein